MIVTDEMRIVLSVNGSSSYTTTINQITNVTNNYNKSVGSLISTLAKLVSTGMVARFAKQCIQAASDLQEVANVVNVTFGASADSINKWAKNNAASFGLSETSAKRYLGTYGTMAKQFDMTTEQAAAMAVEITKLTGDVASFYNITDQAAATKLKSIFTGETESLKELGVVMTETQLNAFAMAKGYAKTVKQMSEQEKVMLRYQFTLEKLSHAQGDFARTSDGYANSTRSLKLNLENLKIEIGNQLLPVVAQGMTFVNKGLQAISPMLVTVAKVVKFYADAWKNASSATKTYIQLCLATFAVMALAPKVMALTSAAVKILTMDITTLGMAIKAVLGLGLAVIAFGTLIKAIKNMKESRTSEEINNLSDSMETLGETINDLDNSTQKLDTFLASFDEVNKVGGGGSLASKIVNADDLSNIVGFTDELNSMNSSLDNLEANLNSFWEGTIFDKEFWKELGGYVTGFFKDVFKGNLFKDWEIGAEEFDKKLHELFPSWQEFYKKLGEAIYDALHPEEYEAEVAAKAVENPVGNGLNPSAEGLENFKSIKWKKHAAGGFPNKGSLFLAGETGAELVGNFGGSQTRVVNQSQMGGLGGSPVIEFSPIIQIDGHRITSVVVDGINNRTRSSGSSPLINLGG